MEGSFGGRLAPRKTRGLLEGDFAGLRRPSTPCLSIVFHLLLVSPTEIDSLAEIAFVQCAASASCTCQNLRYIIALGPFSTSLNLPTPSNYSSLFKPLVAKFQVEDSSHVTNIPSYKISCMIMISADESERGPNRNAEFMNVFLPFSMPNMLITSLLQFTLSSHFHQSCFCRIYLLFGNRLYHSNTSTLPAFQHHLHHIFHITLSRWVSLLSGYGLNGLLSFQT
jgi:hypothetical protein